MRILTAPARPHSRSSGGASFSAGQVLGSRRAPFYAAQAAAFNGLGVFVVVNPILYLARGDIHDELGELGGVARTWESFSGHASNMASASGSR